LPTAQLFFHQAPIELTDDFRFFQINCDLRSTAMTFGQIPIPITTKGPRDELSTAGFLQSAPPRAFMNLGSFVCRHHSLPLGQQLALRRIAKRILQKNPLDLQFLNLFDQYPLMGIVAS
jgi:hypothetical protein